MKKILLRFIQLGNQPEQPLQGHGFGLAITKKILDQQHWRITVSESDLGGAKMIIHIDR